VIQGEEKSRLMTFHLAAIRFTHRALSRLKALFGKVPIVGGLTYCDWRHHGAALREFAVVISFATATFWLAAFIGRFDRIAPIWTLVLGTISRGELFIFSVSLLGPVVYTALDERETKRSFPEKTIHLLLTCVLALMAAAAFSKVKTSPELDMDFVLWSSTWIALAATTLRYLTILYNKARDSSPNAVRTTTTNQFLADVNAHRASQGAVHDNPVR
jgi:hypothetical protein